MIDHFESLADAADTLGVEPIDLVRATAEPTPSGPAAARVSEAIDRLDQAVEEAEGRFPLGALVGVRLPTGAAVTARVCGIHPLGGTAWVDLEVLGPDMFAAEASGCYRACDLEVADDRASAPRPS